MLKKTIPNVMVFLVVAGMILACAAITETAIWKDPEYKGGIIDSVLIIGVAKNEKNRSLFENAFSEAFKAEGVTAHASVKVFQPDQKLTKDNIKQKALDLGVKAVILTHLVSVTEEDVYHPAAPITTRNVYTTGMGNYFTHVSVIDYPGYYQKYEIVRLKTNLYETASEKLIFSIASKTIDPKSVEDTIQSICKAFMKDLKKNDLI
jgi:hypothetical protein